MTVDKPPLALWVQALSVRVFGYHPLSMLVPQALMGVAAVWLTYDLVRRRFGRLGGVRRRARARADADRGRDLPLQPARRAARALLGRRAVVHGARRSRTAARAGSCSAGVCVGLGFETKMLVALVVVPGIAARVAVVSARPRAFAPARRAPAAGRRRGDDARRRRVAAARRTDAGVEPPVDLGHERQPRAVADLRIQRRRARRRPGRRPGRDRRRQPCSAAARDRCGCSTRRSAGRPGGCSASPLVSAIALLVATRLRRSDARTGWLLAVGGAFLTTRRAVQLRERDLPPLLRLAARAVHRRAGRRGRRALDLRPRRRAHLRPARDRRRRRDRAGRAAATTRASCAGSCRC